MARWEANASERLQEAAMALFEKKGYAQTTVGDIAARAGVTERTFFRYFSDKREVLFAWSEELEKVIVDVIESMPVEGVPLDAVASAFEVAGAGLERRSTVKALRARHALVMKHPELRERELIKLDSIATAVTKALKNRGVAAPLAALVAETGLAVFKVGYESWISKKSARDLAWHLRESLAALRRIAE